MHGLLRNTLRDGLRDGYGLTTAAAIASLFYGGPLVVAFAIGSPTPATPSWPAPDGAVEIERVAVWLPTEEPAAPEIDAIVAPDTEHDDGSDDENVVEQKATPQPTEAHPSEAGGMAGEEGGTAELGGQGEGTGSGDLAGQGAGSVSGGAKAAQRPKRKGKGCATPHPNIHPGNDGVLEIDRSVVDHYTKNLETFVSLGYSRPHDEDGLKGWYISGFPCTSVVYKAGFRRGDVLLTVNGKKTRSWVGVFMLYQRLKNKDDFEVSLVRKGQPVTLRFRVVEG